MLTERVILEDVAPSNRVISGAKTLLLKYVLCSLTCRKGRPKKVDVLAILVTLAKPR